MKIKIKYFDRKTIRLEKIAQGDWIDLRCCNESGINLLTGESGIIHLGVGMILPKGWEAHIAPRSSTFRKYGILLTNSVGVIDNTYSGNDDEWLAEVYATKDIFIPYGERLFQFRVIKNQPKIEFVEVEKLNDKNRGGFGSTGRK